MIQDSNHKLNDKRKLASYTNMTKKKWPPTLSLGSDSLQLIMIHRSKYIMNQDFR
jgi:hypothetical protein